MTIKKQDFIEVDYTGKLADGTIFDTTNEEAAHHAGLPHQHGQLKPAVICVGEKQLLPGFDNALIGQAVGSEFTINLDAHEAFGKRDVTKIKIVPMNTFNEHKVQPQPGLEIDMDGERGRVQRVAGGRVIVNFNHPLAGKDVTYIAKILRKIEGESEKISAYLQSTFRLPSDQLKVEITEKKATITMPMQFPENVLTVIKEKLKVLVGVSEVEFSVVSSNTVKNLDK